MVDLVKIGEDTGDVPGALKNVADTYENELNIALKVMMNMIEPVMIWSWRPGSASSCWRCSRPCSP